MNDPVAPQPLFLDDNLHQLNPPVASIPTTARSPNNTSCLTGTSNPAPIPANEVLLPKDRGIPETPPQRSFPTMDPRMLEEGYDSDGQRPPSQEYEVDDYVEEEVIGRVNDIENEGNVGAVPLVPTPNPTVLTPELVMKMKVTELKDELKRKR